MPLTICILEPESIKTHQGHFKKASRASVKMLSFQHAPCRGPRGPPASTGAGSEHSSCSGKSIRVLVTCQASCFWLCLMFYLPLQKRSLYRSLDFPSDKQRADPELQLLSIGIRELFKTQA